MIINRFEKLKRGDIVQHIESGNSYVIDQCISPKRDKYIAVHTIVLTNPYKWIIIEEKKNACSREEESEIGRPWGIKK